MNKLVLYFCLIMTVISFEVKSFFIRGVVYKCGDKYIILLGDLHGKYKKRNLVEKQRSELISELKLLPKDSTVVLIEDKDESRSVGKKSTEAENKKELPMYMLVSELKAFGFNAIDIENRSNSILYIKRAISSLNLSKDFETIKKDYKKILKEEGTDKIDLQDVFKEFDLNIAKMDDFGQEIKKLRLKEEKQVVEFFKKEKDKILSNCKDSIKILKNKQKSGYQEFIEDEIYVDGPELSKEEEENIAMFRFDKDQEEALIEFAVNTSGFLDANIVFNVMKNSDKKFMVICAGVSHTLNIEKLFKKIDYESVGHIGIKEYDPDMITSYKPISVEKVFELVKKF